MNNTGYYSDEWKYSLAWYLYAVFPKNVEYFNAISMHSIHQVANINEFKDVMSTAVRDVCRYHRSTPCFEAAILSHIETWRKHVEDGVLFASRTESQMVTWVTQVPTHEKWVQRERVKWVELERWALKTQESQPKSKTSIIQAQKRNKMEKEKANELQRVMSTYSSRGIDEKEAMQELVSFDFDTIKSVELQLELLGQDDHRFNNKALALQTLLGDPSGLHHDVFRELDAIVQATILAKPTREFVSKKEAMQAVLSQVYRLKTPKLQRAVLLLPTGDFTDKREALQILLTEGFDELTYEIQWTLLSLPAKNFMNKREGLVPLIRYADASNWRALFALPSSEFLNKFQILRYLLTDDVELMDPAELQKLVFDLPNTELMRVKNNLIQGLFNPLLEEISESTLVEESLNVDYIFNSRESNGTSL